MAADNREVIADVPTGWIGVMDDAWGGLTWTAWVPLEREAIRRVAPALPGIYRVRRADGMPGYLVYVGQTGRTLRERLLALAAGANANECPFNDPHTAAAHLWLLRQLDGARFECACAPITGDVKVLRGTEDMLLWRHRVETGRSTEANYGRFYPGYARPTNLWIVRGGRSGTRVPGRRAMPLPAERVPMDFTASRPALRGKADLLQASWWQRAPLAQGRLLPPEPAVYCIYEPNAAAPVYIGETTNLSARATAHAAVSWPVREPWLAYLPLPVETPKYVLREFESDLLGWHFWHISRAPVAQYSTRPDGKSDPTGEMAG